MAFLDIDAAIALRNAGKTIREISEELGFAGTDDALSGRIRRELLKRAEYEPHDNPRHASWRPDENTERYWYNKATERYIVSLSTRPDPLVVPKEVHDSILLAYSNWDGASATLNELSRQFGLPRAQFAEYMRIFGVTKDREPVSEEDLLDEDYDESQVVDNLLAQRRQALHTKYERKKWREVVSAAEQWWHLEKYTLEPFLGMLADRLPDYRPPKIEKPKRSTTGNAAVISTSDMHLGMSAWSGESGEDWGVDKAKRVLSDKFSAIVSHVSLYKPECIYFVVGSDFLHVDTPGKTTERGTAQDVDGSFAEVIYHGLELAMYFVDTLRQVAPVRIFMASGNHDRIHSWNLLLTLHYAYRKEKDVDVRIDGAFRQYATFGEVLMGFTHGDGPKKTKLGALMAHERATDWGNTRHHIWFQGHLHHEETLDVDGVIIYQLPTLIPPDRWHSKNGYATARRALAAYVVNKTKGVIAQLTEPV